MWGGWGFFDIFLFLGGGIFVGFGFGFGRYSLWGFTVGGGWVVGERLGVGEGGVLFFEKGVLGQGQVFFFDSLPPTPPKFFSPDEMIERSVTICVPLGLVVPPFFFLLPDPTRLP